MSTNEAQQGGRFIIFEGGEGAGKSTLVQNLADELRRDGYEVITTREPGGSPCAEEIRDVLIRKRESIAEMPTPRAQLLGHYTARADHLERIVIPALERDALVLCDRFELSSFAYQVYAQDARLEPLFKLLHAHTLELLRPHTCSYVLCDIDPETGVKRALSRKGDTSAFDEMDMDFHYKIREGLQRGRTILDPHFDIVEIDARLSERDLVQRTREVLGI